MQRTPGGQYSSTICACMTCYEAQVVLLYCQSCTCSPTTDVVLISLVLLSGCEIIPDPRVIDLHPQYNCMLVVFSPKAFSVHGSGI